MEVLNKNLWEKILIVAPHFDDEIMGCGGSILLHRKLIKNLNIAFLTKPSEERFNEFKEMNKTYLSNFYFQEFEDGFLYENRKDCTLSLIKIIQKEKPNIIFIPHNNDGHRDHKYASLIAEDAIFQSRFLVLDKNYSPHTISLILEYEVWTPIQEPSIIFDITSVFKEKCNLVENYKSEIKYFPYIKYIEALNTWRGLLHNKFGQAEAFKMKRL